MTVPRLTTKGQKVGSGPIPGNPHPFPKVAAIFFPLISLWNYPPLWKLTTPYPGASLTFRYGPHSFCGMWFSLNKPSFTLLWLALEFFPVRSQEPTLGSHPRDVLETWDMTILSCPTLFPATYWYNMAVGACCFIAVDFTVIIDELRHAWRSRWSSRNSREHYYIFL